MINYYEIGEVKKIFGTKIAVDTIRNKNDKYILFNGELLENVKVYNKVLIKNGFDYIIGEIVAEDSQMIKDEVVRILSIEVQGYISNEEYISGNEKLPMIGNKVYLLNEKLLNFIYKKSNNDISIGSLIYLDNKDFLLDFNKLYASHIGIFGNTGSGKSYTLSKLLEVYYEKKKLDKWDFNEKTIIFDFSGEYENINYYTTSSTKEYKFNG